MKLYIAAIIKDELPSIMEWIAYHKISGADGFIIVNNESKDGSRELLKKLSRIEKIILIDHKNIDGQKPQLPAYSKILKTCPSDIDLLAFIDADEFILPLSSNLPIKNFIETRFADEKVSAVALNWANFGSNGEIFTEEKLVTERFTCRAPQRFNVHRNFKSIVRPDRVKYFHNPHFAELSYGHYIDAKGNDLVPHPKHSYGVSNEVIWDGVRVNHYAVKSLEEFLLGKHLRGSAATANRVKHKAYFKAHDRNDETCLLAASLAPKVKAEMARLQELLDALPEETPQKKPSWLGKRMKTLLG